MRNVFKVTLGAAVITNIISVIFMIIIPEIPMQLMIVYLGCWCVTEAFISLTIYASFIYKPKKDVYRSAESRKHDAMHTANISASVVMVAGLVVGLLGIVLCPHPEYWEGGYAGSIAIMAISGFCIFVSCIEAYAHAMFIERCEDF